MSLRSTHLKIVGAAGATALTVAALASPALATSQDITYNCTPLLDSTSISLDPGSIPTNMVAGQKSKRTMNMVVHLSSAQADNARGATVGGTAVASGAKNSFPFNLTLTNTLIPGSGGVDIPASGPGVIRPLAAGTWTVKAGNFDGNLSITGLGSVTVTCAAPVDSTVNFGTIAVTKDKSKTTTTAKYARAKHRAKGTAKVRGKEFGLAGTGKVKFLLKKGTRTIQSKTDTLNKKGIASVAFTGVKKKGKYKIVAKFGGDKALKASSGSDTFTV